MPIIADAGGVHLHSAHSGGDMDVMVLVAFLLSYAMLDAACRVRAAHGRRRTAWLVAGSLVVGLGIFAFHFVALLAVSLPLPMTADPVTFGVSAVTAVVAAAGALHHVDRGIAGIPAFAISAGLKGFALVATHFTSVAALHLPATIDYQPTTLVLSVLVAVLVSAAALGLAERLHSERPGRAAFERLVGAGVLAGGLVVLHHVSAGAGHFVPDWQWVDHAAEHHVHHLREAWLVPWVVGAGATAVAALALASSISRHRHWRARSRPESDRLTGLGNGAVLRDELAHVLAEERQGVLVAVRLRDPERLRARLGRRDTEELLVRVGERLSAAARPCDLVTCLGLGEFGVLIADDREEVGREVAERLAGRLAEPVDVAGLHILVPAAVGASTAHPGDRPRDVLERARLAASRSAAAPAAHPADGWAIEFEPGRRAPLAAGVGVA